MGFTSNFRVFRRLLALGNIAMGSTVAPYRMLLQRHCMWGGQGSERHIGTGVVKTGVCVWTHVRQHCHQLLITTHSDTVIILIFI